MGGTAQHLSSCRFGVLGGIGDRPGIAAPSEFDLALVVGLIRELFGTLLSVHSKSDH